MATILCVESSSDLCSVALLHNGDVMARGVPAVRAHNEMLLAMVAEILAEAGCRLAAVDVFACGHGPGSFTGVRLAASVVQGYGLALGRGVTSVSSLQAQARQVLAGRAAAARVDVLVDARMQQLYLASFAGTQDAVATRLEARVCQPEEVAGLLATAGAEHLDSVRVGSGWRTPALLAALNAEPVPVADQCSPHAQHVAWLVADGLRRGDLHTTACVELPWLDGDGRWRRQVRPPE